MSLCRAKNDFFKYVYDPIYIKASEGLDYNPDLGMLNKVYGKRKWAEPSEQCMTELLYIVSEVLE